MEIGETVYPYKHRKHFGNCRFLKSFYRELGTRDPPHLPAWASPLPLGTLCPAHFQPHLQLLHKGEQEHRLENIKPDQIFAPVRVSVINHPAETTWSPRATCRLFTSLVKLPCNNLFLLHTRLHNGCSSMDGFRESEGILRGRFRFYKHLLAAITTFFPSPSQSFYLEFSDYGTRRCQVNYLGEMEPTITC